MVLLSIKNPKGSLGTHHRFIVYDSFVVRQWKDVNVNMDVSKDMRLHLLRTHQNAALLMLYRCQDKLLLLLIWWDYVHIVRDGGYIQVFSLWLHVISVYPY